MLILAPEGSSILYERVMLPMLLLDLNIAERNPVFIPALKNELTPADSHHHIILLETIYNAQNYMYMALCNIVLHHAGAYEGKECIIKSHSYSGNIVIFGDSLVG